MSSSLPSNPHRFDRAADPRASEALLAARRAVGTTWSLIAMLGDDPQGARAFLARHHATGELAAVTVEPDPTAPTGAQVAVTSELRSGLRGPRVPCPECGVVRDGWPALCDCGTDLAQWDGDSSEDDDGDRVARRLRDETAGRYEVLGALPHADGRGTAFFARRVEDQEIVALHVHDSGTSAAGGRRLSVSTSEPFPALDPIEQSSPRSGPVRFTPAEAIPVVSDDDNPDDKRRPRLDPSGLGSGLLAKLPTPRTDEQVAVARVCPQCGAEYETGSRFCPNDGSPLRPKVSADPLIGVVIADRYQVLRRLGEGGMGRVYLAEHVKMNRQCALKVMSTLVVNDEDSAQRFAREASNASRIIHPNVAAVFDYGESDGIVYLVMEFVDGEPLSRLLERERFIPPHRALEIARQVTEGLTAAHELGIVHRDLKPDNILLSRARSGREIAKVVDFGIAKAMSDARQDRLTQTGLVIGTPEYMSPEQLVGDPVDARSDIYSLGCILYQMITGQLPFEASTREQIIKRRLSEPPPHPRDLVPGLPDTLDRVVRTMLARSPMERYPSTIDVRDALDPAAALGRDWDPTAHMTPRSAPTLLMQAQGTQTTEKLASEASARRRNQRLAIGALVGLALAGTAIGYEVSQSRAAAARQAADLALADSIRLHTPLPIVTPSAAIVAVPTKPVQKKSAPPRPNAASTTPAGVTGQAPRESVAAAPPKPAQLTAEEKAMRAPIESYAAAWESRDTARVHEAYPALTKENAQLMQNTFFRPAEKVRASVVDWGTVTRNGDTATYPFALRLTTTYRDTKNTLDSPPIRYEAVLVRSGKRWLLTKLNER